MRDLIDIVNDRRAANLREHDRRVLQLLDLIRLELIANPHPQSANDACRRHSDTIAGILNEGTPDA
jgi:hypothetical protein